MVVERDLLGVGSEHDGAPRRQPGRGARRQLQPTSPSAALPPPRSPYTLSAVVGDRSSAAPAVLIRLIGSAYGRLLVIGEDRKRRSTTQMCKDDKSGKRRNYRHIPSMWIRW
jgi:hypothetical protein